ncbi:MAG: Cache 3/Cache 2 fusion domain-containing protein, partial [Rubrivivax sp.]
LRAAVAARVESANIEVVEYSKTLSERVYDALGGQKKTSQSALDALTRQGALSRDNPIDIFLRDLRGVATIFVLTPEGFQRRMTTATDERGGSAAGTFLATDHPATPLLLSGKAYIGPARVFGRQYLTSYNPIFDAAGSVIGASVIGIDMADQLETLKTQIRSMKVGETGYYYIADATPGPNFGTLILHPYKEGQILSDIPHAGGNLIGEMGKKTQGEITYAWKNEEAGETSTREKLVIFETLKNPNWVIAGGSSIDEFTALSQRIVWLVIAGGLAMTAAIFVIILLLLRKLILKPLNSQVLPTFHAMSAGKFDTPLDVRGNDEMAQVIQGLESLRNRLAFESERERTLSKLREAARQEAEALSRARAEFLANMSHEIRTPLNAVIGLAYLLMQSNLGQRDMEYASRIEGAGKLLLAIVNDILDFSKIDAGKMRLEETSFHLDDVLDNLSNLVRTRVQEKGLVLEYVVAPHVPQALRGDALRLAQILINLVSNAIKFTADGSITIFINAERATDGRCEMEFRIQDTGIGMSDQQMANLFRAFSQADSSITRKFGGTGLG